MRQRKLTNGIPDTDEILVTPLIVCVIGVVILGSGIQLIAAEKLGRVCYSMEEEPISGRGDREINCVLAKHRRSSCQSSS